MNKTRIYLILVSIIIIWGIALRSVELINGNFLFGLDHGRDYLAAYNIVENHKLTLIGAEAGSGVAGINGIFHGPGYFYLIALAYILFHGNPIGAEIFMVLFGVGTTVLASWVGYKIFGKTGSVLCTFFVVISPLIVSQSRFIWSSHPITLFVLLALYFVYKIDDNPRLYVPLSLFTAGFTYHSQLGVAVPLLMAIVVAVPLVYRITDWRVYCYGFLAVIAAFLPMLIFESRHGFMAVRAGIAYMATAGSGTSIFEPIRFSHHKFDYWNNFYNTFTFEFGWIPWNIQMVFLKIMMPCVAVSLWFVRGARHRKFVAFLLFMSMVTWIGFLFLNNTVWDYYMTHTRIGYILLFVYAIVTMIFHYSHSLFAKLALVVSIVFLVILSIGSVFRQYITYTIDLHDTNVIDKIKGKKMVIDSLYQDAHGQPFSVFIFVPPIYTFPYDYLFKTYGKQTYGYEPGYMKTGLAYLLIEPDNGQSWRQKGWLETVVQGGETVWKKTMLNGLIVEKRIYPYEKNH